MLFTRRPITLNDLARKYDTDKGDQVTWSDKAHDYCNLHYQHLFGPLRYKKVKLLEVGILQGASLRMWRDYFPLGKIFGVDNDPILLFEDEPRIKCLLGDERYDEDMMVVGASYGPFDIIIDDGCHNPDMQLKTLRNLYQYVKSDGYYVVEDIYNHPDWQDGRFMSEFLANLNDFVYGAKPEFKTKELIFGRNILILKKP